MTKLEQLQVEKDDAQRAWVALNDPANVAYEKYQEALSKYREAVLYEKIRKKVMRELVSSFGASKADETTGQE